MTCLKALFALVVVAGSAHASCALAQMYKCTDASGRTAFSDRPCATSPGGAGSVAAGKDGVKQEVLRQPKQAAATSAGEISAMCAKYEGSAKPESLIPSLPERQREMVVAALRGLVAGMARDSAGQATLKRVSLHLDASRNAVICVPRQLAQSAGASPAAAYVAHRIEPNGRMESLQPGAQPLVSNDANEPATAASRCAGLVTSCVRSKAPSHAAIDECFEKLPACPGGRLDPTLSCCPQACKDAYRRERSGGTDAEKATIKVIFGDDAGATSCIPGMPKRG